MGHKTNRMGRTLEHRRQMQLDELHQGADLRQFTRHKMQGSSFIGDLSDDGLNVFLVQRRSSRQQRVPILHLLTMYRQNSSNILRVKVNELNRER